MDDKRIVYIEKDSILKPITNTSDLTKAYADSEYGKIKKKQREKLYDEIERRNMEEYNV